MNSDQIKLDNLQSILESRKDLEGEKNLQSAIEFISLVVASQYIPSSDALIYYDKNSPSEIINAEFHAYELLVGAINNTLQSAKWKKAGQRFAKSITEKSSDDEVDVSTDPDTKPDESVFTDYYKILGVPENATVAQIRSSYRKKAKSLHPDVNPNANPNDIVELNLAAEVLLNKKNRADYDKLRALKISAPKQKTQDTPGLLMPGVILTMSPTTQKSTKKLSKSAKKYLTPFQEVGLVAINDQVVTELKATNLLPPNIKGGDVTNALKLTSEGIDSVDFASKVHESKTLQTQHKEAFGRAALLMYAIENVSEKEFSEVREFYNNPTTSFQTRRELPPQIQPNQIGFSFDDSGVFRFVGEKIKGKSIDFVKSKTKKVLGKALKKGSQQLAKAFLKKGAQKGAQVAVTAAVEATGISAVAVAAGVPSAGIGTVLVLAVTALVSAAKKISSSILSVITGEKDPKKRRDMLLIMGGSAFLIVGIPIAGLPMVTAGLIGVRTIKRTLSPVRNLIRAAGAAIAVLFMAIVINFILATLIAIISIIVIFVVINLGAYMAPPGGFGTDTEMMISGTYFPVISGGGGAPANPFYTIRKTASIGNIENEIFDGTVTFTIEVCARLGDVDTVSIQCEGSVFGDAEGESYPGFTPPTMNVHIPQGTCQSVTYTINLDASEYWNSLLSDQCCVVAVADGNEIRGCGYENVVIGEFESDCVNIRTETFSNSEYLANLQTALYNINSSYPGFLQNLCANNCITEDNPEGFGPVNICFDSGGQVSPGSYGWHAHRQECDIYLNHLGLEEGPAQATWILAHELTHHMQTCYPSSFSCFSTFPNLCAEGQVCTYGGIDVCGDREDMAEAIGRLISGWRGDVSIGLSMCYEDFCTRYPAHCAAAEACVFN